MNEQIKKCRELANLFEFMPNSDGLHSQIEIPKLFLKHPIKDTVTFFGGSFNPFHEGHRACLDLCPEKNILVVPDKNPFKERDYHEHPYDDFCTLAEKLKETSYSLYPGFLVCEGGNPTADWLPRVKVAEKNLLMGDDSFLSILNWKNPKVVLSCISKLYVVSRNHTQQECELIENKIREINPVLKIIYLGGHSYMKISSTKLREQKK